MSSKIIKLTVQNLLRIEAAEITPDGALVIVAGKNDQGKSSLLNCIAIALSGKDLPKEPIHAGATSGHVILETDQYVITRKFSQTGGGQLIVRDKEGVPVSQPQTKLEALYSLTTFDPLSFTRQKPKEQAEILRKLTGLDFTDLQNEYDKVFAERTLVGRDVKNAHGVLASIKRAETGALNVEMDADEIAEEMRLALQHNAQIDRDENLLSTINDRVEDIRNNMVTTRSEMARLQGILDRQVKELEAEIEARDHQKANVEKAERIDTEALGEKLRNVQAHNEQVRENRRWSDAHKAVLALEAKYADHTKKLDDLKAQKDSRTSEAKFPVEGLAFDDAGNGVTFESHPFEQVSSSKQIRVSLAIACALNPNLRVMLIRDGSLLDEDSLALVRDYAEEHDAQVFMECVGTSRDDATVIIEDGKVVATPAATLKAARKGSRK